MARKAIGASLRWTIFARDGFICRYCGKQAGQEGVELAVDHIVSVAEGGDNAVDNLVTSCKGCNGGKGARSLASAPTSEAIINRIDDRTRTLKEQAAAITRAINAEKSLENQVVAMKCAAYSTQTTELDTGEVNIIIRFCREYGPDLVMDWYRSAAAHKVRAYKAIRYVCGCARNYRENLDKATA